MQWATVALLLLAVAAQTTQAQNPACPAGTRTARIVSGGRIQSICLCSLTETCNSTSCFIVQEFLGTNIFYAFFPTCTNCQCVPKVVRPCGALAVNATFNDGINRCVCARDAANNDFGAVCTGNACRVGEITFTSGRATENIYFFDKDCQTCQCVACPTNTTTLLFGNRAYCECPGDAFCVGSSDCIEETTVEVIAMTRTTSHKHFFPQDCANCVCDSRALDGFVQLDAMSITGVPEKKTTRTVAAECAKLCLDDHTCLSFENGVGARNGDCYLQQDSRATIANLTTPAFGPDPSRNYYERLDIPNVCDNNGGCGDPQLVACSANPDRTFVCEDVDECKILCQSGACANLCTQSQFCVNKYNATPDCLAASPCAGGTACPTSGVCRANPGCTATSCPGFACITTCSDTPCAANADCTSVASDAQVADPNIPLLGSAYRCACKPGFKQDPAVAPATDGSTCIATTACDANNGGCGPISQAACSVAANGGAVCQCKSGWSGPMCSTPVCQQLCRHGGNCTAPDTCSCPTGFIGPQCQICFGNNCLGVCDPQICNAARGTCKEENGAKICVCINPAEYTGPSCDTPVCKTPCSTNTSFCPSVGGDCQCLAGYGPPGVCNMATCLQGCVFGTCASMPNTCSCVDKFVGPLCDACPSGYVIDGEKCSPVCGDGIRTVEEACDDGNSANGDGCSSSCALEQGGFQCITPLGARTTCTVTNPCNPHPCGANATCSPRGASSYVCTCLEQFVGVAGQDGSGCQLRCPGAQSVYTACLSPCLETCSNDCASVPPSCSGGGCRCPDGTVFHNRQCIPRSACPAGQVSDCDAAGNGPNGLGCAHGACDPGTEGDDVFTCDCSSVPFSGPNCETPHSDANNAANGPNGYGCQNGATVVDLVIKDNQFTCDCSRIQYSGANCDRADCAQAGCEGLNRMPCNPLTSLPNTCGACKDGFEPSVPGNLRSPCTEAVRTSTYRFLINADYDSVFSTSTLRRTEQVSNFLQASFLNYLNDIEDLRFTGFQRGSISAVAVGNPTVIQSVQDTIALGRVRVTIDAQEYSVCPPDQASLCGPAPTAPSAVTPAPSSRGGGDSGGISTGAVIGIVVVFACIALIALVIVLLVVRRKSDYNSGTENVVSFTSPNYASDPADRGEVAFANPMYDGKQFDAPPSTTATEDSGYQDVHGYESAEFSTDPVYENGSTGGSTPVDNGEYLDVMPE